MPINTGRMGRRMMTGSSIPSPATFSCAVFRIKGNDYRLVARVFYPGRVVYVRFVGTHAEYNRINVEEV